MCGLVAPVIPGIDIGGDGRRELMLAVGGRPLVRPVLEYVDLSGWLRRCIGTDELNNWPSGVEYVPRQGISLRC
jgi:hypothetical protein